MAKSKNKVLQNILSGRNLVLSAIIIVLIGISYYAGLNSSRDFELDTIVQRGGSINDLSTDGFILVKPEADIVNGDGVVSLSGNCYTVTAGTEPHQALSIVNGMDKKIVERPNTHDVLRDLLDVLDIKLLMVKVVDIRNNNFIGKIILQQGDRIVSLESKPSDGIALAVRINSSIYMNETLMKIYGEKIC